jgi:O-succinylbenzoic acid--CoA ligase
LTDFLMLGTAAHPDRPAVTDGGLRLRYADLDQRVSRLASRLVGAGVRPGDVVATVLGPTPMGIAAVHAVRRSGAILSPLHPDWTTAELETAVVALRPRLMLHAPGAEATLAPLGVGLLSPDDVSDSDTTLPPAGQLPDLAAILWTSGTGGRKRGVEITASALLHSARASAVRLSLGSGDRWLASLQLAHVGGLALVTRAATLGSSVVAADRFDAAAFNDLVDSGAVTHAALVPVMLRQVLEARGERPAPATLGAILLGGAHTPPALVGRALTAGFPVALTYGMTEATSQAATAPPDLVRADPATVGPPLDGVEIRVAGDGELLVRGPTLARGYRDASEPLTDESGWYHTGDLGTKDAAGVVRVTGRKSQRIVTGGLTIDPSEVEAVLRRAEGVRDCVVVGLPDDRWGERVAAGVEVEPGAEVTSGGLDTYQSTCLAPGKRVREWRLLASLPRNANGKVDRAAVRSLFAAGFSEDQDRDGRNLEP